MSHLLSETDDDSAPLACLDRRVLRTQISLEEEQYARIIATARARGTSMSAVIRDAIDLTIGSDAQRTREAARRLLADEMLVANETKLRW